MRCFINITVSGCLFAKAIKRSEILVTSCKTPPKSLEGGTYFPLYTFGNQILGQIKLLFTMIAKNPLKFQSRFERILYFDTVGITDNEKKTNLVPK